MSLSPSDLCRHLADELGLIDQRIRRIREANRTGTQRVQKLTQERTDTFVDLAKHYLPELTQQSLRDAWQEVKREVGDILLRKRDRRRQLRAELAANQVQQSELENQLTAAQEKQQAAKLVLSCKVGNFKKLLRDDPLVKQWIDDIAALDRDIECYLAQHERIEADARRKLPAYERSSLFEYLTEQKFGTPEYQGRGAVRRWDRWVAKMIGYDDAKKSYDFLVSTPEYLKKLIDEKQQHYRSLLVQLKHARRQAAVRHGTESQKRDWERLCKVVSALQEQIEEKKWASVVLLGEIDELENPNGSYYHESLKIYQRFLTQLEPDVMRVYAECTESPVDDEICARLRNVQGRIHEEQMASKDRFVEIVLLEKEAATLREIASRLQRAELETPGEILFGSDFDGRRFLREVRHRQLTPDEAWQVICRSLLPNDDPSRQEKETPSQWLPMEATFAAASEFANRSPTSLIPDASSMVMLPMPTAEPSGAKEAFSTMAIFRSAKEAKRIVKLLKSQSISCFMHTHPVGIADDGQEEVDVVVSNQDFGKAAELIRQYQASAGQPWNCSGCHQRVGKGWQRCWHCGRKRTQQSLIA
ncbi:hypothetical protein [Planctomycetes bacterium K23_9]|uniref:DUF2007 domain-containing protein n=1 Tax=Stieleria marina TaxID=1930275 RepID=A0A517P0P3_9BACT|nr:hypothetical protein K239x_49560 [Planctomycetes bacterium K23_9]